MEYNWLILVMSTSAPILSEIFSHAGAAGHAGDFEIHVFEWPYHFSSLQDFSINKLNFDHDETLYGYMRSFCRCWLSSVDHQLWLRCERKLWSDNKCTSLCLYLNQEDALVKQIFKNSKHVSFGEAWMMQIQYFYPPIFSLAQASKL